MIYNNKLLMSLIGVLLIAIPQKSIAQNDLLGPFMGGAFPGGCALWYFKSEDDDTMFFQAGHDKKHGRDPLVIFNLAKIGIPTEKTLSEAVVELSGTEGTIYEGKLGVFDNFGSLKIRVNVLLNWLNNGDKYKITTSDGRSYTQALRSGKRAGAWWKSKCPI